jgi:hypothetical protein
MYTIAAALLAVAQVAGAEGFDAGFQYVEEPLNARAIGMGTAATACESHGFSYYNPAQPSLSASRYLAVEYGRQSGDVSRAAVEAGWNFKQWFIAASLPTSSISDIRAADERGPLDLYFSSQGTMVALAGGYKWKGLAVALGLHGMQDRIDVYTGYALSVSAGATYWVLPGRLSVGAAGFFPRFLTTSRGMLSEEWGDGAIVNRTGRAGVAWRDSVKSIRYAAALDVVYNDALESITVPVGVEIWPVKMLAVRMGTRINHDTDRFSLGLGFKMEPVTVDAAFVITRWVEDAGLKWMVGLGYSLPRPE